MRRAFVVPAITIVLTGTTTCARDDGFAVRLTDPPISFSEVGIPPGEPYATGVTCGEVITSSVTLDGNLVCDEAFTGIAIRIADDDVEFLGAGYRIFAPNAGRVFSITERDNITISNVIVDPGVGTGYGVFLNKVTNSLFEHITVTNRDMGINAMQFINNGNTYQNNVLTGNKWGITSSGEGNTFSANDLSSNSMYGLRTAGIDFTIMNDNIFENSNNGIQVRLATGATIEGLDFPASIPGTVLQLEDSDQLTVQDISIGGAGTGYGINLINVNSSSFHRVTASNREVGIRANQVINSGNTYQDNVLTGNKWGLTSAGEGNTVSGNDLSNSIMYGLKTAGTDVTITNDNIFEDCNNGILVRLATGATIDSLDLPASIPGTALFLQDSDELTVRDIVIDGAGTGYGINLTNVSNSGFQRITATNREVGIRANQVINPGNTYQDNVLTGNKWGLTSAGEGNTFSGNDLSNSIMYGLRTAGTDVTITNDNVFDNSNNGIQIRLATGATIDSLDFPASIPGTVLQLEDATQLTVRGISIAGSGTGSGINVHNIRNSVLSDISVSNRERGINAHQADNSGNRYEDNTLTGCQWGLTSNGTGVSVLGNYLANNSRIGLLVYGDAISVGPDNMIVGNRVGIQNNASGTVTITANTIEGNFYFGILNTTNAVVVDAEYNYWGDDSGPLDADVPVGGLNDLLGLSNPDGLGDPVTDFVDYYPFATAEVAVDNLIDVVEELTDPTAAALSKLLDQTRENIITKPNAARGQLTGFINLVSQSSIDAEVAAVLIERAEALKEGL